MSGFLSLIFWFTWFHSNLRVCFGFVSALYKYITINYPFYCWWALVLFPVWGYCKLLLWLFLYKSFGEYRLTFHLGIYPKVEFLSHRVSVFLTLADNASLTKYSHQLHPHSFSSSSTLCIANILMLAILATWWFKFAFPWWPMKLSTVSGQVPWETGWDEDLYTRSLLIRECPVEEWRQ